MARDEFLERAVEIRRLLPSVLGAGPPEHLVPQSEALVER
jgi:hypothetical protein